jgi:phage-related protein
LGFKVDDTELKKFDALTENAKAKFNTFISSLKTGPSVDDSSIQQLGETIDSVQAKTESLGSEAVIAPAVDDAQLKQLGETVADTAAKTNALGSETIGPQTDGSSVSGLGDELDRTKSKADKLGKTKVKPEVDTNPVDKLGDSAEKSEKKVNSLTSSILKANLIMKAASKAMGAAFGFIRDSVIGTTAETERFRVALGTMLGDQERANKIIRDLDYGEGMFEGVRLSDFYGTANAIGGLQNMVTFGMQAEEAGDVLARLGDIAQGDSEAFVSMSNAMGQVFAQGKADSVRLKQFAARGFDVVGEVARQTGKSRKEIEKSGVTYEQTAAAIRALTNEGGKYHGMLAKQMNTLGGILKQYASVKAATAEAIGSGISDQLKELLKYILAIGRAGQENFVNVFVKALKEVIHWIWQIIIMWKVLGYRLAKMGDALAPVKKFFASLRDMAEDVFTGIMTLAVALGKAFLAISIPISAFLTPVIQAFGRAAKNNLTGISELIDEITPMFLEWAPIFEAVGKAIGEAYEKVIPVLNNVNDAIIAVVTPIKALLTPIVESLQPLFENVFGAVGRLFSQTEKDTNGLADIIKGLTPIFSALGNIAAFFIDIFGTGIGWIIESLGPFLKYVLLIIGAIKAWAVVQGILNAVMAINPIGAIILAVIAFIGLIGLLIKSWDKVRAFFVNLGRAVADTFMWAADKITGFFTWAADKIKAIWNGIIGFFKKWGEVILQILAVVIFGIPGLIAVAVRQIIKHWDVIGPKVKAVWGKIIIFFAAFGKRIASIFLALVNKIKQAFQWAVDKAKAIWNTLKDWFAKLVENIKEIWGAITGFFSSTWEGIVSAAVNIWNTLKDWFAAFVEAVKSVWSAFPGFFSDLWDGIVNTAMAVWDTLKSWFSGLAEDIKNIWSGIAGFFSGLWEALMQGPAAAVEYIKNAFFGLFASVQEKLFGFIGRIREGWEAVKGFFGGIGEGVVNFFTGGSGGGGPQMQPAYAGSTSQAAVARTVGQTSNYAYTTTGGSNTTVNARTTFNMNVPAGTPAEQSEALARQLDAQFDAKLAGQINSSRADIPSPEVRRH